jgi:hypothetical protein
VKLNVAAVMKGAAVLVHVGCDDVKRAAVLVLVLRSVAAVVVVMMAAEECRLCKVRAAVRFVVEMKRAAVLAKRFSAVLAREVGRVVK